jgi:hypothetical protein
METPLVYEPLEIPIINPHELPDVRAVLTSGIIEQERIKDRIKVSLKTLDVDTLLHVVNRLQPPTTNPHWSNTTGSLLMIVILYLVLREAPKCPVQRRPSK